MINGELTLAGGGIRPYPQEALGGRLGLTNYDVAYSLGVPVLRVNRKIKRGFAVGCKSAGMQLIPSGINSKTGLPEEAQEFKWAMLGSSLKSAIDQVGDQVFRPARKHGYDDTEISALLEKIGEDGEALIGLLEAKFYDIVRECEI